MMRKITYPPLLVLYVITLLQPLLPHVHYSLNKEFIAKVLCINRDRPEMKCEGKCHLAKMIREQEDKGENGSEERTLETAVAFPHIQVSKVNLAFSASLGHKTQFGHRCGVPCDAHRLGVFHPPRC